MNLATITITTTEASFVSAVNAMTPDEHISNAENIRSVAVLSALPEWDFEKDAYSEKSMEATIIIRAESSNLPSHIHSLMTRVVEHLNFINWELPKEELNTYVSNAVQSVEDALAMQLTSLTIAINESGTLHE
jgi:hypothetical protein